MKKSAPGWPSLKIGDKRVCSVIQPGFACGTKDVQDGVPHLRMNNISPDCTPDFGLVRRIPRGIAEKRNRWLEPGDVLFCNTNSTELVGKTCLFAGWEKPCTFSNHLTRLRANEANLHPKWLAFCLWHLWRSGFFAVHCTEFIGQSAFNRDKLEEVEVPVPPLPEQRRIVRRIEELTRRVNEVRRVRATTADEIGRWLPTAYLSAYLDLGGRYESVPLAKTGRVFGGGTPSRRKREYWQGEIPWISPKNMKAWRISGSTESITQQAVDESSARLVPCPGVLFVVRGMILQRNIPVAISDRPVVINQDMKAIVPDHDFDAEFLASMIRGAESILLSRVETAAHGTRKLETSVWSELRIPKPPTLAEQRRIVGRLDALRTKVEELGELQREVEAQVEAFTPALLAKAFQGEL